jgi:hypothetical protein
MIDGDLRKMLIAQIGSEFSAHSLYMGISVYFDRQSLRRWGKFFRDQAIEEAQHGTKIMDFLIDNEIDFDLPAVKAVRLVTSRRSMPPSGHCSPSGTSLPSSMRWRLRLCRTATIGATSSSSGSSRSRSRRKPRSSR